MWCLSLCRLASSRGVIPRWNTVRGMAESSARSSASFKRKMMKDFAQYLSKLNHKPCDIYTINSEFHFLFPKLEILH